MALVQVKIRLALCAEVFAEAGLTVVYPTPCEKTRETDVSQDSRQTSSSGEDWRVGEGIGVREGLWVGKKAF